MSAVIGCIMVALAVLGLTAQVAYCLGEKRGMKDALGKLDEAKD
jgi:hypothetical protein